MTGRYAIRTGATTAPAGGGVYGARPMGGDDGRNALERWLRDRHVGKCILPYQRPIPTDQGFDEWYGIPNSTDESPYSILTGFAESGIEESYVYEAKRGEKPVRVRPWRLDYRPLIDRDLTDKAIDFMRRKSKEGRPFFLYLPYTATHFPTLPHPDFAGSTGNGNWADMLAQIDSYNGELLAAVDELGIRDNTIFVFTADNGPEAAPEGNNTTSIETPYPGSAGPWRGTLFTGFEGSLRVPFAIRWPGKIPAGSVSNEIVHEMDLFATFARIAGGKVPDDRIVDSIDQTDFLLGKQPSRTVKA